MRALEDFDLGNTTFAPSSSSTMDFGALTRHMASTPFYPSKTGQPATLPEPGVSFIKTQAPVAPEPASEPEPMQHENTHREKEE